MGSRGGGVAGDRASSGPPGTAVDKGVDFANYFCTYAFLYHQKEMLSDRIRMDAYFNAIFENKHHFHGKTVLDVGTGSGILAIWSAQAGARKVYAVEATSMAIHARELVKAHDLDNVVEVIEGSMEEAELPEKVDVIISEWMGYFLLRESMLDSVICARDRWLKPDGVMYPSHARLWLAPITSGLVEQRMNDYNASMEEWAIFLDEMRTAYGVDMSILTTPFTEEQEKYYLQTSMWNSLYPHQLIGIAAVIKEIDCLTVSISDIRTTESSFRSLITENHATFCGFGGWFDVHFKGRTENPAREAIELSTAPSSDSGTHWGQQVFLLHPPIRVRDGDELQVAYSICRSGENHRLLEVDFDCQIKQSTGRVVPSFKKKFFME